MIYPRHIAVIPDWNRTWAQDKWFHKMVWHLEWEKKFVELAKYVFSSTPIEVFTIWWLSTENLKKRNPDELEYLFELYKQSWDDLYAFLKENKVNFKWVGSEVWLPDHLITYLRNKESELKFDTNRYNIICVNYGGRDEIVRWVNKLISSWKKDIVEKDLEECLDFAWLPNVELVVRSKWDMSKRLSWFMLWWIWYAELYFTAKKFPDVNSEELENALKWFDSVSDKRNFWK